MNGRIKPSLEMWGNERDWDWVEIGTLAHTTTSPPAWQSYFAYATKTHAKTYTCMANYYFICLLQLQYQAIILLAVKYQLRNRINYVFCIRNNFGLVIKCLNIENCLTIKVCFLWFLIIKILYFSSSLTLLIILMNIQKKILHTEK